jgi:hypothetical protein
MKPIQHGESAMALQRGEVQGYDFNRMIVEFTMLNQDKLFDTAGTMGEILQTADLRGKIARYLHLHKDEGPKSDKL